MSRTIFPDMKKIVTGLFISVLFLQAVGAQLYKRGLPFITNYLPTETGGSEQNWAIVQDQRGVMYFGNNDKGVLEYDGVSWRSIPISNNSIVRSLAMDSLGTVYVGGVGEFGYLVPDRKGKLGYISLSERLDSADSDFTDVWKTYTDRDIAYYCTYENTYIYNISTDTVTVIPNDDNAFWSHLVNGNLYHSNLLQGLLVQRGDTAELMPGGEFFAKKYITCILPFQDEKLFIGTGQNGVYIYDPVSGNPDDSFLDPAVNQELKDNLLYQGISLGSGRFGLSTHYNSGGFLIIDEDGELIQRLNKASGLQDEQIIYAFVNPDNPEQSPLWLALNIGISKAEINSHIRFFNERSGLSGTINDIIRFNGILYVATSSNAFYLEENPDGTVEFRQIKGLTTQLFDFAVFSPPDGGADRLFLASISGLHEITGKTARTLDLRIRNRTSMEPYDLRSIVQAKGNPKHLYIGGNSFVTLEIDGSSVSQINEINLQDVIQVIAEDKNGDIWLATSNKGVTRIRISGNDTIVTTYSVEHGLPSADKNYVYNLGDELFFATTEGIFRFNEQTEVFYPDTIIGSVFHENSADVFRMIRDRKKRYWISYEMEGQYREAIVGLDGDSVYTDLLPFYRLPNKSTDAFYDDEQTVWLGKSTELYRFYDEFDKDYYLPFYSLIRQVTLSMDSIVFYGTDFKLTTDGRTIVSCEQNEQLKPSVKYSYNNLMITLSAPFFESEGATLYRYWLDGEDSGWGPWSERDEFERSNLRPGDYRLHVQARNVYGVDSSVGIYEFTILPPWYQTIIAYITYFILLVVLIVIIVKLYTRRLVMENIKLEGIIEERTAEIRRQKEELTDSIEYASRIQQALLPSHQILKEEFPDHFILFKPRDIVSGDFYWMGRHNGKLVVVAADCTGHGVPGAFMSMLGITYLNEVVNTMGIMEPNRILDELRQHVMISLKQTGEAEDETKDGMDLALMVIDQKNMKLQYAGAYNPLYFVRSLTTEEKEILDGGEELELSHGALHNEKYVLEQLDADKMPIGISVKRSQPFKMHEIDLRPGYNVYINSDGYVDQFGGPKGKKFMSKNFKKLLLEIQDLPMSGQGKILDERLLQWQGDTHPQIDDIIVIGIRYKNQGNLRVDR